VPPTKLLASAPEEAVKGAALLFIEHSVLYPDKAGIYVNILRNIVIAGLANDSRRSSFMQHFNAYVHAEMKKYLKEEKPQSSNWPRVNMLSVFLCELFNQNVIEVAVIQSWLDKLQMMALRDCGEAAKEYNECVVKVGDKIGDENLAMIGVDDDEIASEMSDEDDDVDEVGDGSERSFEMVENESGEW
jgi:hypothetical protein